MIQISFKKITCLLLLSILLGSCSKQLDGVTPKDAIPTDALRAADIVLLRNGMYNRMEDAVFSVAFDFDVRGENFAAGPGFALVDPIGMTTTSIDVAGIWRSTYTVMLQVNNFIEGIDALGTTATAAQLAFKGEALYFRALLYYNLVTRFGGVPLMNKKTYEPVQRSTEQETWNFIINDLNVAQTLTQPSTSSYYVSTPAVHALLAKTYLAQKKYDSVITYANRVIASGRFAQATDSISYASMFVSASTSRELVFALANNTPSNQHLFFQSVNDVDPTWDFAPSPVLYTSLYSDTTISGVVLRNDRRRSAVFLSNNTRITKFPNGRAGQQLVSTPNAIFTPIVVSRYTDVILALAEAQSLSPNSSIAIAAATLNTYFINRYRNPPTQASVASLSATAFQNLILNERRREFFGEGQWWYDVKRTNRTSLFSTLAGRNFLLYYPIPQGERDLAGYTQNNGY
jgi:starch-binding outer membrane protein, SusD/RagB family